MRRYASAERTARARPVEHDYGLAKPFLESLRERTRHQIGRSPRAIGHHDLDGAAGSSGWLRAGHQMQRVRALARCASLNITPLLLTPSSVGHRPAHFELIVVAGCRRVTLAQTMPLK